MITVGLLAAFRKVMEPALLEESALLTLQSDAMKKEEQS